jgi:DNA adenine methylase
VFLCNRDINDGFYDDINLKINKFDITYTAGRRKKTEDGFEAKPATELLIRN